MNLLKEEMMMNKAEFITELEKRMVSIPQLEKERIMNYYNETIEDAKEDGVSEEDSILSFGTMDDIMQQINAEHEVISSELDTPSHQIPYARRILLFITFPFWLTAIALMVTLYLMYITVILMIGTLILAILCFLLMGCFHIFAILIANFASGIVLLGCMLFGFGMLPWIYSLFIQGIHFSKVLYQKGVSTIKIYWRKAVAYYG